jgi:DNA-binding Lrp family transcriptional regulator
MWSELDATDRKLLNALQREVPLVPAPFAALGAQVGLNEGEVLRRIRRLKEGGVVRQIAAIFDGPSLGYRSSLVAARVVSKRLDEAARAINEHPGVSHNYRRTHDFNLWFTIAVGPTSVLGLERTAELLGELAEVDALRLLPTLKLFKINMQLDMSGDSSPTNRTDEKSFSDADRVDNGVPSSKEIGYIRELQKDLEIVPRPFDRSAEVLGAPVETLLEAAERFGAQRRMRRFAAVLHHRAAGFKSNVMGVWRVPSDCIEAVGEQMSGFRGVSHCYQRPTYPDWPYNIFTMVHGRTKGDCEALLGAIAGKTRVTEHAALWSSKEYKKARIAYFTPESDAWEARYA